MNEFVSTLFNNITLEVGLVVRAIMWAVLFTVLGIFLLRSEYSHMRVVKITAWIMVIISIINVFMAIEWIITFWGD
jgi:hypothetical protein